MKLRFTIRALLWLTVFVAGVTLSVASLARMVKLPKDVAPQELVTGFIAGVAVAVLGLTGLIRRRAN
jgi:nitrate reductase gamma subunit